MVATTIAIRAGRILTPEDSIRPGVLLIKGQRLAAVGSVEDVPIPPDAEVIDAVDKIVVPGFIDIHMHGWGGASVGESEASAQRVAISMARNGTTSFLPSLGASGPTLEGLLASLRVIRAAMEHGTGGAEILGVHAEGPYLSGAEIARGSVSIGSLRRPSVRELNQIVEASGGTVRVMSIAPELDGALDVIREMVNLNIVPSAAHSAATYEQAMEAVDAGLRSATHTFNGMIPMHHRKPGLVGAVLTCDKINAELIGDGAHVGPVAMQVLLRCKGTDRVTLITDSTHLAGSPNGEYQTEDGRTIIKEDFKAWVVGGTLYGSVSPMNKNVANIVNLVGYSLSDALKVAALNPAKLIGVADRKGSLEAGKDADLVIIDDEVNMYLTMVQGRVAHRAEQW
jgi:N-acetylglucosamine-6-phosphate deacetylase